MSRRSPTQRPGDRSGQDATQQLESTFERIAGRLAGGEGPPRAADNQEIRDAGAAAAAAGLTAREAVDLYLSCAARR